MVRAQVVGENPDRFVGKQFLGRVGFLQSREVWSEGSEGISIKWLSIYKLRKRMKGSLYFTLILKKLHIFSPVLCKEEKYKIYYN